MIELNYIFLWYIIIVISHEIEIGLDCIKDKSQYSA